MFVSQEVREKKKIAHERREDLEKLCESFVRTRQTEYVGGFGFYNFLFLVLQNFVSLVAEPKTNCVSRIVRIVRCTHIRPTQRLTID